MSDKRIEMQNRFGNFFNCPPSEVEGWEKQGAVIAGQTITVHHKNKTKKSRKSFLEIEKELEAMVKNEEKEQNAKLADDIT